MKGTDWGWSPPRAEGIWKYGCKWAQPLTVAAPWITLALLFVIFHLVEGRLTAAPGVVFDLPEPVAKVASAIPQLAAVVLPVVRDGVTSREVRVFFDDEPYSLTNDAELEKFRMRLARRVASGKSNTLLLLADARVASGDLMKLTALAREAGVAHVQIAEKRE